MLVPSRPQCTDAALRRSQSIARVHCKNDMTGQLTRRGPTIRDTSHHQAFHWLHRRCERRHTGQPRSSSARRPTVDDRGTVTRRSLTQCTVARRRTAHSSRCTGPNEAHAPLCAELPVCPTTRLRIAAGRRDERGGGG
jgi:hypothetical protein